MTLTEILLCVLIAVALANIVQNQWARNEQWDTKDELAQLRAMVTDWIEAETFDLEYRTTHGSIATDEDKDSGG